MTLPLSTTGSPVAGSCSTTQAVAIVPPPCPMTYGSKLSFRGRAARLQMVPGKVHAAAKQMAPVMGKVGCGAPIEYGRAVMWMDEPST